jgi:hypothetical protein
MYGVYIRLCTHACVSDILKRDRNTHPRSPALAPSQQLPANAARLCRATKAWVHIRVPVDLGLLCEGKYQRRYPCRINTTPLDGSGFHLCVPPRRSLEAGGWGLGERGIGNPSACLPAHWQSLHSILCHPHQPAQLLALQQAARDRHMPPTPWITGTGWKHWYIDAVCAWRAKSDVGLPPQGSNLHDTCVL